MRYRIDLRLGALDHEVVESEGRRKKLLESFGISGMSILRRNARSSMRPGSNTTQTRLSCREPKAGIGLARPQIERRLQYAIDKASKKKPGDAPFNTASKCSICCALCSGPGCVSGSAGRRAHARRHDPREPMRCRCLCLRALRLGPALRTGVPSVRYPARSRHVPFADQGGRSGALHRRVGTGARTGRAYGPHSVHEGSLHVLQQSSCGAV